MKTRTRLSIASLTILTLVACQQPSDNEAPAQNVASPAPATAQLPSPLNLEDPRQLAQAFDAAWGAQRPAKATISGKTDSGEFTFTTAKLEPVGGDRYALISSGQGQYDSHASSGALAIHYLDWTPSGFRRAVSPPLLVEDGQYGSPSEWSIRNDLLPSSALVTDSVGTAMGYVCESVIIVEFTPERPIRRVDRVRLGFSNGGAVEDPKDRQDMEAALRRGPSEYEFTVQYSGASNARVVWRLAADGSYRPVNEPAGLPWC